MAFRSMRFRRGATAIEYGILAALIVVLAIFAITTTGINLNNVFDGLGNGISGSISQNNVNPTYIQNCGPASQDNISYYDYPSVPGYWSFPSYTCGQFGINGPETTNLVGSNNSQGYNDALISYVQNGKNVPYASLIGNSNAVPVTGSSGTAFNDGYSFNAAFVSGTGLNFSQFQTICQNGGNSIQNTLSAAGLPSNLGYNAPPPVYASGNAYETPTGDFVCGHTKLTSGTVQGAF